ncbi:unnamed protein product [Nezara viridula]|uniref:Uncharacterized protein n=1 Tax=Nezara viridula TaxID=85310 RepID=A0A9P0HU95_NEZVI|nr:unnamed protein product [Nezara viridula]
MGRMERAMPRSKQASCGKCPVTGSEDILNQEGRGPGNLPQDMNRRGASSLYGIISHPRYNPILSSTI